VELLKCNRRLVGPSQPCASSASIEYLLTRQGRELLSLGDFLVEAVEGRKI